MFTRFKCRERICLCLINQRRIRGRDRSMAKTLFPIVVVIDGSVAIGQAERRRAKPDGQAVRELFRQEMNARLGSVPDIRVQVQELV